MLTIKRFKTTVKAVAVISEEHEAAFIETLVQIAKLVKEGIKVSDFNLELLEIALTEGIDEAISFALSDVIHSTISDSLDCDLEGLIDFYSTDVQEVI